MNFNSDLSKSYPFYPIPGLSELSEESGHPSSNVNHPLHHTTRHEAATRILNTPDAAFVSQIVDAFSATPNEHLNPAQQSGCIDGINPSPLLQAVLAPNPYDHRNTTMGLPAHMPPMNLLPPNPATGAATANFSQLDSAAARVGSIYPGNTNRLPVTRPVQAVAPQPRVPRMVIQSKYNLEQKQYIPHEKSPSDPITPTLNETPEENPKICLKIRRTKKSHHKSSRQEKRQATQSAEYGIVSSDDKPPGAGPIKLKISRLKSSAESFKVASLTTATSDVSKGDPGSVKVNQDQQKAEDAASAMIKTLFSDSTKQEAPKSTKKAKSSRSEKYPDTYKTPESTPTSYPSAPATSYPNIQATGTLKVEHSMDTYPSSLPIPSPQMKQHGLYKEQMYSPVPSSQSRLNNSYPMFQPQRTSNPTPFSHGVDPAKQSYQQFTPNPIPQSTELEYSPNYHKRQTQRYPAHEMQIKSPQFRQQQQWAQSHSFQQLPPKMNEFQQPYLATPPPYNDSLVSQSHKVQGGMYPNHSANMPAYPTQHDVGFNYHKQSQHHGTQYHDPNRNQPESNQQQYQQQNPAYIAGAVEKPLPHKIHDTSYGQHIPPPMTPQSVSEVHNAEISPAQQMPQASHVPAPAYGGVQYFNAPTPNKPSSMGRTKHKTSMKHKRKGGGLQYVRVKFAADAEEADIYKLSDVMYLDDSEVSSFDELEPGTHVVAKWPMNGKRYEAVVIDPLDNTGRRFRERKPPPKPFQAADVKLQATLNQPSIVLDKLDLDHLDMGPEDMTKKYDVSTGHEFGAYLSMADRIKLKRREMLLKEGAKKGKKRKRESESSDKSKRGLINTSDESEDETFVSPSRKRSHIVEHKKKERRKAVEERLMKEDGAGLFRRLSQTIERIFDDMDTVDPRLLAESAEDDDMQEVHPRLLISKSRLQDLSMETAKLKAMGLLCQLPKKTLVRLLSILEPNIRNGVHATPCKSIGNTAEEQRWNRDNQLGRVATATDAALTAMNIMTAPYMPKAVYLDDVMERSAQLLCRQLANTIFPEYDLVYKVPSSTKKKGVKELTSSGSTKMKRAHYKGPKNHMILQLYNKLNVMVNQWVELVRLQPLTDTTILQISSVGVSPFFVENVRELQLSSIKLTTALFSKYDKHRALILEDIFQSLARLPTSKQNLRNYRLTYTEELVDSSDDESYPTPRKQNTGLQYVQMVSALMLQMIQAIVHLPEPYQGELSEEQTAKEESTQKQVDELQVINSYDCAVRTGQNFLSVFLKKCASKSDETDYRPLFENFIHDLLATVNKPEWPASEMLLSVLGRLLVHTFSTKSTEMSLRVASLDYLGVVAAKLRRDAVTSNTDVATVRNLLKRLEELSTNAMSIDNKENEESDLQIDETKSEDTELDESKLIERLECLLLAYLRRHSPADPSLMFAHNFYIGQWLRDASVEFQQVQQQENVDIDTQTIAAQTCQAKKGSVLNLMTTSVVAAALLSVDRQNDSEQMIKLSAKNVHKRDSEMAAGLTVEDAMLLSRHLASTRQFSRAFDCYLSYILRVREESAVALRTRAIKCLAEVVAVDPSIMSRTDIAKGVRQSLVDSSTSVREAAIDLVGRFILLKPELVPHYYDMLSARIMDTGVSVRKRVIRILRDLCHEHPQLPQLTDACVKMIRRVNDEDGIKKLVHEVFMKMWFTPVHSHDAGLLRNKALLITDIVAANRDHGYEWIEQLFKNLIDTSVPNPQVELACKQIVDCLVQHVILFEQDKPSDAAKSSGQPATINSITGPKTKERSVRLVATVQTLVQLARIRPRLLVNHVMTLQPYLATKCETPDDLQTVHGVCRVLELAVPLMEHPSEAFLATVEEDMMRMILTHRLHVVSAAIASLGAITCYVTNNYKLIWDCFQKMCNYLSNARITHEKNPSALFQTKHFKQLLRALYIIGHFSKTFDFDNEKLKGKATICVKEKVYDCIYYFTRLDRGNPDAEELCTFAMRSLGLLMIQDPNMMFLPTTRDLYKSLLSPSQSSDKLKKQVLLNLQTYLQTEDVKMQAATEASIKKAKHEVDDKAKEDLSLSFDESASAEQSIKEIKDVSSGMASSVMQLFLKEVLESFFHHHSMLRHAALHTIYLTLQQGLVHPVQCVPYLIAAASDTDPVMHKEASQQLTELNKRYVGFVHTKALQGLRLAFQLQTYIQPRSEVIRGYYEATIPSLDDTMGVHKAKCSHLYQMVRSDRKHRRALLISILNLFDDTVKTDLEMLLFLADNLAHFPYHTLDEPLFLISQVEVYVSVSGSNVLQSFKESLQQKSTKKLSKHRRSSDEGSGESSSDEDESETEEDTLRHRLPDKDAAIEDFAQASLACLLLLWVKQHLKTAFGLKDSKIHQYSTTEVNKANDKQCHRKKSDIKFQPTQVVDHIKRIRQRVSCRSQEYIDAVVMQYREFDELMNKLDPNDDDSDSEKEKKPTKSTTNLQLDHSKEEEDSDRDTDGETPSTAPLDIIRKSTALKSKKTKVRNDPGPSYGYKSDRKRPVVQYAESSSDSEAEFHGF